MIKIGIPLNATGGLGPRVDVDLSSGVEPAVIVGGEGGMVLEPLQARALAALILVAAEACEQEAARRRPR